MNIKVLSGKLVKKWSDCPERSRETWHFETGDIPKFTEGTDANGEPIEHVFSIEMEELNQVEWGDADIIMILASTKSTLKVKK